MKKWITFLGLIVFCYMSTGCDGNVNKEIEITDNDHSVNTTSGEMGFDSNEKGNEEDTEVDICNRTIIAEALGVEDNSRNIRFILNSLNTIGAGKIQCAEVVENDREKVINLVAEDGTDYRIYLSGSGSVEAVENLATGEWPIKSTR